MNTGSSAHQWFFASQVDGYDVCIEQIDLEEGLSLTFSRVPSTEKLKYSHCRLALRDVSRDLRTFIDRHHLHYHPIRMHVYFDTDSAIVRISGDGDEVTGNCSEISSSWLEKYGENIQSFSCDFHGYSSQKMQELKNFLHSSKNKISMASLKDLFIC